LCYCWLSGGCSQYWDCPNDLSYGLLHLQTKNYTERDYQAVSNVMLGTILEFWLLHEVSITVPIVQVRILRLREYAKYWQYWFKAKDCVPLFPHSAMRSGKRQYFKEWYGQGWQLQSELETVIVHFCVDLSAKKWDSDLGNLSVPKMITILNLFPLLFLQLPSNCLKL
jgi:hypothetical protein